MRERAMREIFTEWDPRDRMKENRSGRQRERHAHREGEINIEGKIERKKENWRETELIC